MKAKFILASESPRRKELISFLDIAFTCVASHFDEQQEQEKNPLKRAQILAKAKRVKLESSILDKTNLLILSADTVVDFQGKCFEKPKDLTEAKWMLNNLSNMKHLVHTAVSMGVYFNHLNDEQSEINFFATTEVVFDHIDPATLEIYLKTKDYLDKSGAYGIQGMPLSFIKSINGSFANVMGLPIERVRTEMMSLLGENWRERF